MRPLPRLRAALGATALALCAIGLAACTEPLGTPDPTGSPVPSAGPSSPPPRPSPSPSPALPAAAERSDLEGAIAAAQHFLELYPYAYNTGDLATWKAMSHPECVFCASVVENVEELHSAGGYEVGGHFTFETVTAREPLPGNEFFAVDFTVRQDPWTTLDASGEVAEENSGGSFAILTAVAHTPSGWLVRAVSHEETE